MTFFRLGTAGWGRAAIALSGIMLADIMLTGAVAAPAMAQVPMPLPQSPEAADIASCLCLQQAVDATGTAMSQQQGAYEASRREVADLDAQLQNARMNLNVENPAAVAQFRQLLDRRDAAYRQSSGVLFTQYQNTVALYNNRVNEFNARCANRPRNPALVSQVQAALVCPPVP
jgi:hypothetical protein